MVICSNHLAVSITLSHRIDKIVAAIGLYFMVALIMKRFSMQ